MNLMPKNWSRFCCWDRFNIALIRGPWQSEYSRALYCPLEGDLFFEIRLYSFYLNKSIIFRWFLGHKDWGVFMISILLALELLITSIGNTVFQFIKPFKQRVQIQSINLVFSSFFGVGSSQISVVLKRVPVETMFYLKALFSEPGQ